MPDDDPYGLQNLPYASLREPGGRRFAAVRVGGQALDLTGLTAGGEHGQLFAEGNLDAFLTAGPLAWSAVRTGLVGCLTDPAQRSRVEPLLRPLAEHAELLAFTVADYVDFYASENHARNVGQILRPGGEPLTPNWRHLPIGYHGRAGTVVVSGGQIRRPRGQMRAPDGTIRFGPTQRLDLEAEVGFVVGAGSAPGRPVPVRDFRDHVFGVCLVNDWSARDIQAWESTPLGPFLGKSFATSVSAWITPMQALEHAWIAPPPRDPAVLAYLDDSGLASGLDLMLEISVNGDVVSRPPFASMYWTPAQMLAHLTVNGAFLRTGDLFASGTVSGAAPDQRGSLIELTRNGAEPLMCGDGQALGFLRDGDEVLINATAPAGKGRIALGEVRARIAAAAPEGGSGAEALEPRAPTPSK